MSRLDSQCSSEDVNKEDECLPSSSEDSQDGTSTPMENEDEPEFSQKHYDIEPCYYSLTGKSDRSCRGIVYRYRKDSDLKGFQSHDGTLYRLRDSVFVEVSQNEPYVIAAVCGFKYTKRDHVVVKLTRYFRADDIPELSLNLMKQERAELEINPNLCPQSLNRELFNSELQITQAVSCLRGKCIVEYVKDIRHARAVADFSIDNDTFFFCLHYNQDSTKLASTHYAIRVGTSFQATLPPVATCSVGDEKDRDELLYRPNSIEVEEEEDYIKLARCYRTFTLSGNHMLDSQKNARYLQVSDLLMDEAIIQLHRSGYKIDDALSELNANDIILTTDVDYMTQDDAKKFAKGIKQLGKNFSRIHRELLPHHSREQLVSYYYLWKKTPEATKPKQAARRVNPTSIKRPTKEKVKASRPTSTEYLDFDSASESDVENNGPSGRACHHCYGAESKDWHHANGLLLCTDCRLHYKKYGQLRNVVNRPTTVPACLFKRSNSDEEESGVRTRAGKKEQRKRTPSSMSETPDRRSPATNGASNLALEDTPTKKLNGNAKRALKRPLQNGAMNNGEKANSSEPSSPTTPPPTLTNGLTNGHAPETSTPNGESVTKRMKMEQVDEDSDDEVGKMTIDEGDDEPMPVLNGFKKEESVEEIKLELNGSIKEENDVGPTTSISSRSVSENGAENCIASVSLEANDESNVEATIEPGTEDVDEEDGPVVPDDISDTFQEGTEVEFETTTASFVRAVIRSCGPRCARTDLNYKIKKGSKWDKLRTEREDNKDQMKIPRTNHEAEARLLAQQFPVKKEQQAHLQAQHHAHQQQQQAQHNAQQMQLQQLQQAMMLGHLQPELLRMMPQQFADPASAMLMQQMMNGHAPGINVAALQHIALQQHMEHAQHAQLMRMQQEIAHQQHQKLLEQQRNAQQAAAAREREQQRERERERIQQQQAQQVLQQQQQAAAAAASVQMNPQLLQMMQMFMGPNQNVTQQDIQKMAEMAALHQQAQQAQQVQQAQQAQQAQREQQERERKEREAREREAREQREREQAAREQAAREQAAREQAAREAQQQQAAAAANMDQLMLLQLLNPNFMLQMQHAQQQHPQQAQNTMQMMQHAMAAQGAAGVEMMRRLQPESAVRPQHQ